MKRPVFYDEGTHPGNSEADVKFDDFMEKVNAYINREIGLCAADLPDHCYRDAFDNGKTPKVTAKAAIRAAK